MIIGDRIRALREAKKLSQGNIEKRSGLKRAYISRVENGHTVPSVETLEKLACALEVPLYTPDCSHANAGTLLQKAAQGKVGESTRRALIS